jgi:DNA-directed RNA polymerase subunit RPC12/RpoP
MHSNTIYECEACGERTRGPLTPPYECAKCGGEIFNVLIDASVVPSC